MTSSRAFSLIRQQPHYRHEAFLDGLKAAGYRTEHGQPYGKVQRGDVLVIWNRGPEFDGIARQFERQGGTTLVAENGYLGADAQGIQRYAIALHGHNGSGIWFPGDGSRFAALGLTPAPWREAGDQVVIRGQRGIGVRPVASPANWHREVAEKLRRATQRPVKVVEHPGSSAPYETSWSEYLKGAHALVIWSSAVGVKALMMGIPVIACSQYWVCRDAAAPGIEHLERLQPWMDDARRLRALEAMAWAQWTIEEIGRGDPFRHLLQRDQAVAA